MAAFPTVHACDRGEHELCGSNHGGGYYFRCCGLVCLGKEEVWGSGSLMCLKNRKGTVKVGLINSGIW